MRTKFYYPTHALYTSPTLTYKEPLPEQQVDDILHASELETELFDEVQSPRCTFCDIDRDFFAKRTSGARVKSVGGIVMKIIIIIKSPQTRQLTTDRYREINRM